MDNRSAFLALVGFSEGANYNSIVTGIGGMRETFTDVSQHPFEHREPKLIRPGLFSTASGKFQIILPTWHQIRQTLGLHDFGPASQDAAAVYLIRQHGALASVDAGDVETAMRLCCGIWASLPGSPYGQPTHPVNLMVAKWEELLDEPAEVQA